METKRVSEWFPKFAAAISAPQNRLDLEQPLCWEDPAQIEAVAGLVDRVQVAAIADVGEPLSIAAEFFKDLADIRGIADSSAAPVLDALQIMNATQPLNWARSGQQWHAVYDWLYYAANDLMPVPLSVEFSVERIRQILTEPDPRIRDWAWQDALNWLGVFYNFAWKVGGVNHLTASLLADAMTTPVRFWPVPNAVMASIQIATWATNTYPKSPPPLLQHLWRLFQTNACPELRKELGITFTCIGHHLGIDPKALARHLLADRSMAFVEHERLQVLVNSCAGDIPRIRELGADIAAEISRFSDAVTKEASESRPSIYRRERTFELITPVLGQLVAAGETDLVRTMLCAWKGVPDESALDLLYICPTLAANPSYAYNGKSLTVTVQDMDASLGRLTETGNRFYQTTVVLRGASTVAVEAPLELGVPSTTTADSNDYERAIDDHFQFEVGCRVIPPNRSPAGLLPIPWSREPVQACMLKASGATAPLASSFEVPLADRKLKHVMVWHRGTLWGHREAEWLRELFEKVGVVVDLIDGTLDTEANLRERYESPFYDAIWITGHGELEHFKVDQSKFAQLAPLDIWASWRAPQDGRRLLVLNMCDSSTAAVLGGLGESGLAAKLARRSQAVIGNLWPVATGLSSIFSVLLAHCVCECPDFFEAYKRWLWMRIGGRGTVLDSADVCARLPEGLVSALQNSSEDWGPLFAWGSAAFHS